MAVTQIVYEANLAGVHPATQTNSGYKLDHQAYSVLVNLSDDLLAALNAKKGAGTLVYRFDSYDAAGGYDRTATAALTPAIEFSIPKRMTRTAGTIRIIPVVTAVNGNVTVFERTLGIIYLKVKSTPAPDEDEYRDEDSLSSLEKSARDAAAAAQEAKEICLEAQEATEEARLALEGDNTTYIFDGGYSAGEIPVDVVIDDVITENSRNAVSVRAVYAALHLLESNMESYIDTKYAALTAGLEDRVKADISSKYFGVGKIYISADPDYDPNGLIPGTWELIGAGMTLICAGVTADEVEYTVGQTGGARVHTLSVDEIPKHRHYDGARWNTAAGAHHVYGSNGTGSGAAYDDTFGFAGGGLPHNNMPPYLVVNIWIRVENEDSEEE